MRPSIVIKPGAGLSREQHAAGVAGERQAEREAPLRAGRVVRQQEVWIELDSSLGSSISR